MILGHYVPRAPHAPSMSMLLCSLARHLQAVILDHRVDMSAKGSFQAHLHDDDFASAGIASVGTLYKKLSMMVSVHGYHSRCRLMMVHSH